MVDFDSRGQYNGKMLEVPVHRLLPEGLTVLDGEALSRLPQRNRNAFEAVIDDFGVRSAKAQGLGAVITTVRKMMYTDQRLFVNRGERTVNGILKTGRKKLFIRESVSGKMHEIEPLCVLDFYVHESKQRSGLGKVLFEEMLHNEGVRPHEIGYDRPSPKLLGFLRKHYNLSSYEPQTNNFVVFKSYFDKSGPTSTSRARAANRHGAGPGRRTEQPPSFFSGSSEPDRRGGGQAPARSSRSAAPGVDSAKRARRARARAAGAARTAGGGAGAAGRARHRGARGTGRAARRGRLDGAGRRSHGRLYGIRRAGGGASPTGAARAAGRAPKRGHAAPLHVGARPPLGPFSAPCIRAPRRERGKGSLPFLLRALRCA